MEDTGAGETVAPTKMARVKVPVEYLTKREIDAELYLLVEQLMELRKNDKQWQALDKIVAFYKKAYPAEYKEAIDISRGLRGTRGDDWGRGDKDLHKQARQVNLRMVMNMPFRLIAIIRKLYDEQELPFDRKFLKKFGAEHPEFLVPKKGAKSFSD